MNKEYVLPLRPAPMADESLLGYLQRLAEANSSDRVHWITDLAGLEPTQSSLGQADLTSLARLCKVGSQRLEQMRYLRLGEGHVSFMGHKIPRDFVRNAHQKVCGPCLAEAGYHRAVWDLAFVTACPVHQVELIDACADCGRHLRWNRPSVTTCQCEADLAQQSGQQIEAEEADALGTILQRFQPVSGHGSKATCPDDLGPSDFIYLIQFLGRNSLYLETGVPQQGRTLDRPDIPRLLRSGLEVAQHWPYQFHELLDRVQSKRTNGADIASLTKRFGSLYKTISRLHSFGWGGVVREGFREYLRANPGIPILSDSPLVEGLEKNRAFIDLEEAATILRVNPPALRRMLHSGAGRAIRMTARGGRRLLNKADVEEFGDKLSDTINVAQLRDRLGIASLKAVGAVASANVFACHSWAKADHKRAAALIASDVDAFFQQLEACASQDTPANYVRGFKDTWNLAKHYGVDLPNLLVLMRRGKIEPVGIDAQAGIGLNRYLFDGEVVKLVLRVELEQRTQTVSSAIAAQRAGVPIHVLPKLVNAELLESKRIKKIKGLRITNKSLDKFERSFSTLATILCDLAAQPFNPVHSHNKSLLSALDNLAVRPARSINSEGKTTRLYNRSDINLDKLTVLLQR